MPRFFQVYDSQVHNPRCEEDLIPVEQSGRFMADPDDGRLAGYIIAVGERDEALSMRPAYGKRAAVAKVVEVWKRKQEVKRRRREEMDRRSREPMRVKLGWVAKR